MSEDGSKFVWVPYVCCRCGRRDCYNTRPGFVRLLPRHTQRLTRMQALLIAIASPGGIVCLN
jgi:hypothetical protein